MVNQGEGNLPKQSVVLVSQVFTKVSDINSNRPKGITHTACAVFGAKSELRNQKIVFTMTENHPALEKFLNTCRTEFRFLVTDFGFQEYKVSRKEYANPFKLSFIRDDLEISIEGIHYGSAAMVLLTDKKKRVLAPRNLDPVFNPLDRKTVRTLQKANGQTEEIAQEARLLLEHGRDLLNGDFSVFENAFARKTQAWAEYEKRREFGIATQEAVKAYDEGKWQDVIELLEPHEPNLSKKMAKKLAFARSQI